MFTVPIFQVKRPNVFKVYPNIQIERKQINSMYYVMAVLITRHYGCPRQTQCTTHFVIKLKYITINIKTPFVNIHVY